MGCEGVPTTCVAAAVLVSYLLKAVTHTDSLTCGAPAECSSSQLAAIDFASTGSKHTQVRLYDAKLISSVVSHSTARLAAF